LDSTGKYPTGLFQGTQTDLGAFDECLETVVHDEFGLEKVRAQYCSVYINVVNDTSFADAMLPAMKMSNARGFEASERTCQAGSGNCVATHRSVLGTINDIYVLPSYHAACYFAGGITYLLIEKYGSAKMPKVVTGVLWTVAAACCLVCVFVKYDWNRGRAPKVDWPKMVVAFCDKILWAASKLRVWDCPAARKREGPQYCTSLAARRRATPLHPRIPDDNLGLATIASFWVYKRRARHSARTAAAAEYGTGRYGKGKSSGEGEEAEEVRRLPNEEGRGGKGAFSPGVASHGSRAGEIRSAAGTLSPVNNHRVLRIRSSSFGVHLMFLESVVEASSRLPDVPGPAGQGDRLHFLRHAGGQPKPTVRTASEGRLPCRFVFGYLAKIGYKLAGQADLRDFTGHQKISLCTKKHATKFAACMTEKVYAIPLSCGARYIEQTGRFFND
ncbi:hypothetical protein HPB47_005245, partial [Ixodes persulcatus]